MDSSVLELVFHNATYGLILLDERGRIVRWNRWIEDRSRRAASTTHGCPFADAFGSNKLSRRLLQMVERSLEPKRFAGRSQVFAPHPLPLRDPADPKRWLVHALTARSLTAKDGKRYCLLEINDLTDSHTRERLLRQTTKSLRKQAQELAALNAKLAAKNRELDEFTYQASHDLQEPLRKLTAFSDLLRGDLGDDVSRDVEQDVFYIHDAAQRMSRLVEGLLHLSHAGNSAMSWLPLTIDECIADVLETLSLRLEEASASVQFDAMPAVHGDLRLLTQLYQNLVGNALKFQRNSPPHLHFTCEETPDGPILGVKDNGIGIAAEDAALVFSAFRRLHTRQEFEGTGIGLSICQRVVERHGGRIWVESELNHGAHFRFTLGAEPPPGVEVPVEEAPAAQPKNAPAPGGSPD